MILDKERHEIIQVVQHVGRVVVVERLLNERIVRVTGIIRVITSVAVATAGRCCFWREQQQQQQSRCERREAHPGKSPSTSFVSY